MVTVQEQTCWLVCHMTSQSQHKDIYLRNLKLELNPEFEEFIEIVDSLGCNQQRDPDFDSELCIEPGETYECSYKLKIGQVDIAKSFINDRSTSKERKNTQT